MEKESFCTWLDSRTLNIYLSHDSEVAQGTQITFLGEVFPRDNQTRVNETSCEVSPASLFPSPTALILVSQLTFATNVRGLIQLEIVIISLWILLLVMEENLNYFVGTFNR